MSRERKKGLLGSLGYGEIILQSVNKSEAQMNGETALSYFRLSLKLLNTIRICNETNSNTRFGSMFGSLK